MKCTNCGNQVGDGMKFCPECGMALQTPEGPSDRDTDGKEEAFGKEEVVIVENMERTEVYPPKMKKYNIGHLGVLAGSILTMVAAFIPNLAAQGNLIELLTLESVSEVVVGRDGKTYALILAALLIVTVVMGCLGRNLLMVIGSIISMGWIIHMFRVCGRSPMRGLGLLLFPVGGILLVISAVAALVISRKNADRWQMDN